MIPSFPTVAVLMRITMILYLTVTRHPILQRIFSLIFPESEPGQQQKKYAAAWENHKGYYLRNSDEHSAVYFGMINQFQEFVHLHVNNSQYITYIIEKPKTDCSVGVRIISTGNSTDLSSLYILT